MISNTFKKSERLAKKKLIQELFSKGSSFYLYPFKVTHLHVPRLELKSHQVLVSVPKRNHKTAVGRNNIKRRIREAYRLNKRLIDREDKLLIAYIYTAKEVLDFKQIEDKLAACLSRLHAVQQSGENEKA